MQEFTHLHQLLGMDSYFSCYLSIEPSLVPVALQEVRKFLISDIAILIV